MAESNIFQVVKSVLAAFVGIQNNENRELDFTTGKMSHYIAVGLVVTVLFIATLVLVVSLVIGI